MFRDAECRYHSSYMLRETGEDGADIACAYAQTKMRVMTLTVPDVSRGQVAKSAVARTDFCRVWKRPRLALEILGIRLSYLQAGR